MKEEDVEKKIHLFEGQTRGIKEFPTVNTLKEAMIKLKNY